MISTDSALISALRRPAQCIVRSQSLPSDAKGLSGRILDESYEQISTAMKASMMKKKRVQPNIQTNGPIDLRLWNKNNQRHRYPSL